MVGLLVAVFAFVAAIGGVIAGVAGSYQAHIAYDTEVVSNRALVISNSLRFLTYQDSTESNREWQIAPIIENVGNTPTSKLRFITELGLCRNGPPAKVEMDKQFSNIEDKWSVREKSILGPKSDVYGYTLRASNIIMLQCPIAISAWGIIKYSDIFKNSHITEFCTFVLIDKFKDFLSYAPGASIRVDTHACDSHNCIDEECGPNWRQRAAQ